MISPHQQDKQSECEPTLAIQRPIQKTVCCELQTDHHTSGKMPKKQSLLYLHLEFTLQYREDGKRKAEDETDEDVAVRL
ncbi:uncharacterized [Tachysurus ichikawai]